MFQFIELFNPDPGTGIAWNENYLDVSKTHCFSHPQDIEKQEGYQAWIIGIVEKGQRTARIIDKPRVIEVTAKT